MSPLILLDRLEKLPTLRLSSGGHRTFEQGACAMELVAWLANEPHSDHPCCACPVIGAAVRRLNDQWPDKLRNELLVPLLPRLVGSKSTREVEIKRAYMMVDHVIRSVMPELIDKIGRGEVAKQLRALSPVVDSDSAEKARVVCRAAAGAYAAAADASDAAAAAYSDAAAAYSAAASAAAACSAAAAAAADAARRTVGQSMVACIERMLAIQPEVAS